MSEADVVIGRRPSFVLVGSAHPQVQLLKNVESTQDMFPPSDPSDVKEMGVQEY